MKLYEAKKMIKNVFENSFNKKEFAYFIKNLLKDIEEKPFGKGGAYTGNLIPRAYQNVIRKMERIGKFKDEKGNVIDILIVELNREHSIEFARTTQRNFIRWYLNGSRGNQFKEAALVAFYTEKSPDWRFSFIKMQYSLKKGKDILTPAKRSSFLVGEKGKSHTAQQQLIKILQKDNPPNLSDLENAFNVETVTDEFFEKYKVQLFNLKDELDKIVKKNKTIKNEFEQKNIDTLNFAKKLLGQIVFLYFLQKKGWLGLKQGQSYGEGNRNFMRELFEQAKSKGKNFFNNYLEFLFYDALSRKRTTDFYERFNCRIPFLNGGLFDPINFYDWEKTDIIIPNELFSNKSDEDEEGTGILDIFDLYNFTVKEDEPLEKEVAIDPEMLGKVFERMLEVKERKSKGAFYTPREIVHYMAQQSLLYFLDTELKGKTTKEDLETFILFGEQIIDKDIAIETGKLKESNNRYQIPESIRKNANDIDKALENIKICDPAVGSGAFPVGVMNEIVKLRNLLTPFIDSPLIEGCQTESDGVFKKYKHLPYNPKLKQKAKELRKAGNLSEVLLWQKIKNKQLLELDFHRQKIIGNYIVDFYCPELDLVIEIDGASHDFKGEYDFKREEYLKSFNLKVIHFEDKKVKQDLNAVLDELEGFCLELKRNTPSLPNGKSTPLEEGNENTPSLPNGKSTPLEEGNENTPSLPNGKSTPLKEGNENTPSLPNGKSTPLIEGKRTSYFFKANAIRNSIYGVDIDPGAVEIAKLRLWLSMVVDESNINRIDPLPNLEYKIVRGNSLINMPESTVRDGKLENEIQELTKYYYTITDKQEKQRQKQIIDNKIQELLKSTSEWAGYEIDFDFKLYFHEVFNEKGGFDIVIGNPPYVQLQKAFDEKLKYADLYKKLGFETFERMGDIYTLFYENGIKILKKNGILCYITSNKWMRANYGKSLRKFFSQKNPLLLIDLGPGIFSSATVDTNILLIQNEQSQKTQLKAVILNKTIEKLKKDDFVILSKLSQDSWIILSPQEQKIKEKIEKYGTPLKDWDIKINYGIKTGYNEAFIIDGKKKDELIAKDPKSAEIIKPILRGRDIKRYKADFADKWLINTHNGYINSKGEKIQPIDINDYPAIKEHLDQYWIKLKKRDDKGKTPYNLRNCAYLEEFEKEKIVYGQFRKGSYHYIDTHLYVSSNEYIITAKEKNYLKYLISLLNSNLAYYYLRLVTNNLGGNTSISQKSIFLTLPIPQIPKSEQKPFEELVDIILKKKQKGKDTTLEEKQINKMVYKLYNLTDEEIRIVEGKSKYG